MVTRGKGLQQGMGGSHARAEHQAVAGALQTGQGLLQVTSAWVTIPPIHWLPLHLLSCQAFIEFKDLLELYKLTCWQLKCGRNCNWRSKMPLMTSSPALLWRLGVQCKG